MSAAATGELLELLERVRLVVAGEVEQSQALADAQADDLRGPAPPAPPPDLQADNARVAAELRELGDEYTARVRAAAEDYAQRVFEVADTVLAEARRDAEAEAQRIRQEASALREEAAVLRDEAELRLAAARREADLLRANIVRHGEVRARQLKDDGIGFIERVAKELGQAAEQLNAIAALRETQHGESTAR